MPFLSVKNDYFPFLKYFKLILACCFIPNYCGVRMPQFQIKFTSQGLCLNVIMRKWKVSLCAYCWNVGMCGEKLALSVI